MPSDQKRNNDTDWEQNFGDEVNTPDRDTMNDHIDSLKSREKNKLTTTRRSTQDQDQGQNVDTDQDSHQHNNLPIPCPSTPPQTTTNQTTHKTMTLFQSDFYLDKESE